MILGTIGSWLVTKGLSYLSSFYTKKIDNEVRKQEIGADVAKATLLQEIEIRRQQKELQIKELEHWSLRFPKVLLFFSVSVWVSLTFIYSALGIPPSEAQTLAIPENFQWIVYAIIGYWTLDRIRR